jgi:dihydrodipicolinate synthase/N-acetylneuraminate lyase
VAEAARAGVHGVVSALANVVPERVEAVFRSVVAGGSGEAGQAWLSRLRELTKALPQRAALKALVAETAGLPHAAVRPPQAELLPEEVERLRYDYAALAGVSAWDRTLA